MPDKSGDNLVYQNLTFERRWMRFERTMWLLMTAMLAAACFGVFGRGAYARQTTESGPLQVKFERILRSRSQSEVTVSISESATREGQVRLIVSGDLLDRARMMEVHPQPSETTALNRATALTFKVARAEPATVTFVQKVQGIGRIQSHVGINHGPPVSVDQIILP